MDTWVKDLVVFYGAILSTAVAAWNLFTYFNDKGKLKVHCYIGRLVYEQHVDDKDYLIYNITNTGRKPIWVTNIGGEFKTGDENHFLIKPSPGNIPKKLEPGEYLHEWTPDLFILSDNLKSLTAYDSLGNTYKCDRKTTKRLIKESKGLKA
ncbi:hypothetical protein L1765_12270 [Microaerobacter geothermalis]|uniref:hypothetical protein n=1 Tax=Microaerobacter geothermalis TaxID=674972 RepID=UPI001F24AE12|nr:hypothetical protein [Microaerobacter geothermalis]MCF6094736.1 hypothetical protein [Microaerobacter geothermalis]